MRLKSEQDYTFNNIVNAANRHNKLFNDYKAKQRIINELQQKYLFKEGEKYTFYPIINNYIIKYNKPFFPNSTSSDIYYEEPSINNNYLSNTNKTNNITKINYLDSLSYNIKPPSNFSNNKVTNKLKKSFQNKNICLASIDENTINNMYKKVQKYRSTNANREKPVGKKSINNNNKNNNNNKTNNNDPYENRNNTYEKDKMNGNNKYIKISRPKVNHSEKDKIIQKTNSIKTIFSNNSLVSKNSNMYKNMNAKKKSKNNNKDMNNILKINIPIEEINNFNYYTNNPIKKSFVNTITSSNNYLSKSKEIKNSYNNKTNNNGGLSLKYLIQDEKIKNKSKSKKSTNISKQKANKIIDNIFNTKNNMNSLMKLPTLNSTLKINTDDYIDLNENPNNIVLRSDNFNYCSIEDNPTILSKNVKTENNYKKLNLNNKYSKINTKKSYENDTLTNSRTITLTENQSKQNKKHYNNSTYNKTCNTSLGQKDNTNTLNQVILYNSNDYISNVNRYNGNQLYLKNNTIKINQNKTKNLKEKNIPIPVTSYNKLYIPNKIKEGKRGTKNKTRDEEKYQKFLYNKYKYKYIIDSNNNNNYTNEDTYQTNNNYTEIMSKDNRTNTISNTQSIDDEKACLTLKEKKYDINNKLININNTKNDIVKGRYVKNQNFSFGVNGKRKDNNKINNNNNFNNYKISTNEINQYYSKNGKEEENSLKEDIEEKSDLSIQSLSDSKVFEIANTYVDEHIDKNQVDGILTHKKKQNQYSICEK